MHLSSSLEAGAASGRRALLLVAGMCLVLQMVSATVQQRELSSPNTATLLAQSLVRDGTLALGGVRAFHLPGEPLYLAAGFASLPQPLWRYLHVPVAVLLVTAVAAVALAIGGPPLAIASGLVASLDPFVLAHGPVWDDTFLAASLEWSVIAVVVGTLARAVRSQRSVQIGGATLAMVTGVAALAAITRAASTPILGAVALTAMFAPPARPVRALGWAIVVGLVLALGAWGARNAVVIGSFHVGSTHDGKTLYESTCRATRDGIRRFGVVGGVLEECSDVHIDHFAELGEVDADRQFRTYALRQMAAHPLDTIRTGLFKTGVSVSGVDFSSPVLSARNVVAVSSNMVLLALAPYGLWRTWRPAPRSPLATVVVLICAATAILTLLALMVGPSGLRYRITLAGCLHLGAAAAVLHGIAPARRHHPIRTPVSAVAP